MKIIATPANGPADLIRELRAAVGLTQDGVAAKSGGKLQRVDVNKIEKGRNDCSSDRVRSGLATAFGLTREQVADYIEGRANLRDTLALRGRGGGAPAVGPLLRTRAGWADAARRIGDRYQIPDEIMKKIGDMPWILGPVDCVDEELLADLARDLYDWTRRVSGAG